MKSAIQHDINISDSVIQRSNINISINGQDNQEKFYEVPDGAVLTSGIIVSLVLYLTFHVVWLTLLIVFLSIVLEVFAKYDNIRM